jgi:acetyl esterase/lipase
MRLLVPALAIAVSFAAPAQAPRLPSQELDPGITAVKDIPYVAEPVEPAKQALDVYRREGVRNAPVLIFIHGGAWVRGDRAQYPFLANRFAREGFVVVVPSYRLSPKYTHPAQIEDAAAAAAWTLRNIGRYGGDPKRVAAAGHSAGAHLAALLATNPRWLKAHNTSPDRLRGVIGLSGVYDLTGLAGRAASHVFGRDPDTLRAASPRHQVTAEAPPFLLTYCQFDYPSLPEQARDFHEAIRALMRPSTLVYIPGETHITEILSIVKDGDPTFRAMLDFLHQAVRK